MFLLYVVRRNLKMTFVFSTLSLADEKVEYDYCIQGFEWELSIAW